jgi:ribonuclease Z
MAEREVVFLGTASQVPTRTRSHNALVLLWDDLGVLIDPGEGTQRQMLLAGVSSQRLTHILLTHFHGDHCLGLPGVVQRLSLDRVPHPVEVVFPAGGAPWFERLRAAAQFEDAARLAPHPVEVGGGEEVVVGEWGGVRLTARALQHRVECQGYRLQERDGVRLLPDRLEALGVRGPTVGELVRQGAVRVGDRVVRLEEVSAPRPGQSFALVMDSRPCPAATALARDVDLLVCEATYLESERPAAEAYQHMTAAEAAHLAHEAGARRLVLTHFSQRYLDLQPFLAEASAIHPDVVVAEDLRRVAVPPRRP